MLPTFVIGLREGLEAALIVGIVAAFLRQRGRLDLLRWAWIGVGAATALCVAIGVALEIISHELPQKQQEGLETVIGACAVVMVTYMVVWMRRHSRTLKAQLEGAADHALAAGSGFALVMMAFLAVLREGLETVVFLLAAFNQSGNTELAATGAVLGIVVAVALGWGIYRGGVRLNLSRFFRITGIVLTFVAAGLVVSALHTAHEAGWLNAGQQSTVDLSGLVSPGSVQAALLTGMLGVQPYPVVIEIVGWLVYLIPVGLYVAWPPGKGLSSVATRRLLAVGGGLAVIAAIALAVVMPDRPGRDPVTRAAGGISAQVLSRDATGAVVTATVEHPGQPAGGAATTPQRLTLTRGAPDQVAGIATDVYTVTVRELVAGGPSTLSYGVLAQRNGGRLPLGVRAGDGTDLAPVTTTSSDVGTFWIEPRTGRVLDVQWREATTLTAQFSIGPTVIGSPATADWRLPNGAVADATGAARRDLSSLDDGALIGGLAVVAWVVAGLCALVVAGLALASRRDGGSGADLGRGIAPTPKDPVESAGERSSTPRSVFAKS